MLAQNIPRMQKHNVLLDVQLTFLKCNYLFQDV